MNARFRAVVLTTQALKNTVAILDIFATYIGIAKICSTAAGDSAQKILMAATKVPATEKTDNIFNMKPPFTF